MIHLHNLTLYTGRETIRDGAVLTDGNKILYAGKRENCPPAPHAQIMDCQGGVLMPGFYNAHCHGAMTLLRGVGSDLNLQDWLHTVWPIEARLTPELVYWGTSQAILEMLRRGVVAFADMYFFMEQVGKAAADTGVRANLSRGCMTIPEVDSVKDLYANCHGMADGRVRVSMGVHGEYTSNPQVVAHAVELARELGMGFHVHISETASEHQDCIKRHGVTPVKYFSDLGMLDSHTIAAHCVHITQEDIAILAQKGTYAVHNPASNMKLGSGFAPVTHMLKAGVNVALGTDGAASNNSLDMLGDMRLASILQKGYTGDPTALNARDSITMATRTGALALGFQDAGFIEQGMQADMILLDGQAENLIPAPDVPAAIVYAAHGLNVRMTMVAGNVLYLDGRFPCLDEERILAKAREAVKTLGVE